MSQTYVIKSGDTLGSIAKTFLGDAGLYRRLWALNHKVLEAEHRKRTSKMPPSPHWIYPGVEIVIHNGDGRV